MKITSTSKVSDLLHWSYANLAMAEKAVHDRDQKYSRLHFMIRARLLSGLTKGTMSPRSLMLDQRIRMKLPQECVYCGSVDHLAIDHIVPTNRGGADTGDNAIWACRRCNSSKSDRDLFAWWFTYRQDFPPLFVVRIYLKQAIEYFSSRSLMDSPINEVQEHPFSLETIPKTFPPPGSLSFSPFHARQESKKDQQAVGEQPPISFSVSAQSLTNDGGATT
jgi:hypothetical protein